MKEQKNRPIKTAGYTLDHQVTRRRQQRRIDAETRADMEANGITGIPGMRRMIAGCEQPEIILSYLRVGSNWRYASAKTRRAWASTAKKRLAFLKANLQNEKSVRK